MLKNTFLYQVVLHELKKQPFSAKQKVFVYRKLYALPSKTARFLNQNIACSNHFLLSSKTAFSRTKTFLLHKPFLAGFKNHPFSQTKNLSFAESLRTVLKKQLFYVQKAFYSHKPFLITIQSNPFLPSATHFNAP